MTAEMDLDVIPVDSDGDAKMTVVEMDDTGRDGGVSSGAREGGASADVVGKGRKGGQKKKKRVGGGGGGGGNGKRSRVLYLGHLPPLFEEPEILSFLSQFGSVESVRLCRSKKFGRSKGYGFVMFDSPEVAGIVVTAMSGYLLGGRRLVCHAVPNDKVHPSLFSDKNPKALPPGTDRGLSGEERRDAAARNGGAGRTRRDGPEMAKIITERLAKRDAKRRSTLASLGIEYDYPGYQAPATGADEGPVVPPAVSMDDGDDAEAKAKAKAEAEKEEEEVQESSPSPAPVSAPKETPGKKSARKRRKKGSADDEEVPIPAIVAAKTDPKTPATATAPAPPNREGDESAIATETAAAPKSSKKSGKKRRKNSIPSAEEPSGPAPGAAAQTAQVSAPAEAEAVGTTATTTTRTTEAPIGATTPRKAAEPAAAAVVIKTGKGKKRRKNPSRAEGEGGAGTTTSSAALPPPPTTTPTPTSAAAAADIPIPCTPGKAKVTAAAAVKSVKKSGKKRRKGSGADEELAAPTPTPPSGAPSAADVAVPEETAPDESGGVPVGIEAEVKAGAVVGTPSPADKKVPPMSKNQAKKARMLMLSAKKERRKSSVKKARETVTSVDVAAPPTPTAIPAADVGPSSPEPKVGTPSSSSQPEVMMEEKTDETKAKAGKALSTPSPAGKKSPLKSKKSAKKLKMSKKERAEASSAVVAAPPTPTAIPAADAVVPSLPEQKVGTTEEKTDGAKEAKAGKALATPSPAPTKADPLSKRSAKKARSLSAKKAKKEAADAASEATASADPSPGKEKGEPEIEGGTAVVPLEKSEEAAVAVPRTPEPEIGSARTSPSRKRSVKKSTKKSPQKKNVVAPTVAATSGDPSPGKKEKAREEDKVEAKVEAKVEVEVDTGADAPKTPPPPKRRSTRSTRSSMGGNAEPLISYDSDASLDSVARRTRRSTRKKAKDPDTSVSLATVVETPLTSSPKGTEDVTASAATPEKKASAAESRGANTAVKKKRRNARKKSL